MGNEKQVLGCIRKRRSVRSFSEKAVSQKILRTVIEAGRWAPSGHNNQPWRFVTVTDPAVKDAFAGLTAYGKIVKSAKALIAVFLDTECSYDRDKDMMAMGACIQNMLLYAASAGIGTTWLGEILKNKEAVRKLLGVDERKELVAVIALGYFKRNPAAPARKSADALIIKKF